MQLEITNSFIKLIFSFYLYNGGKIEGYLLVENIQRDTMYV